MKTKFIIRISCQAALFILLINSATAQQPANGKQLGSRNFPKHQGQPATFNYKVFQAPNNLFGYDIYQDGKGVFHQPAALFSQGKIPVTQAPIQQNDNKVKGSPDRLNGFSRREDAENAARLSIEKIKRQAAPALTDEEIQQIFKNVQPIETLKH